MMLSMSHFITSILLVLIPVVASFSFNLTNIGPQNLNREWQKVTATSPKMESL
ncbi:hypothetical protein Hanom_Chr03g00226891 [Helianthus anomalus]